MKANVNIAIVEMPRLKTMIENFEKWKSRVLSSTEESSGFTTNDVSFQ
jgi:hypothetical protein